MGLVQVDGHVAQCMSLGTAQTIAYTASSAAGTAFGANTHIIRVQATTDCHIRFGLGTPTAVATDTPLTAGVSEYFAVFPSLNIAVIRDAADGTLYVTEDN